jgi:hypothetical protein
MNILNKILPAHSEHNKESIDIITKLESARESPNKESEGLNFGTEHINSLLDDKDLQVHPAAVAGLEKLTGVKLGEGKESSSKLVGMWKDYLKETKVEL